MKILLAIPHTGNLRAELAQFLISLNSFGHEVKIFLSEGRPISHNRNLIVKVFLESEMDYLLQIDSDIVPPKNIIEMVNNNVDFCSADIQTCKGQEIIKLALEKTETGDEYRIIKNLKNGLNKVDATGTGCCLISRKVFEKLKPPYYKFIFDEEGLCIKGEDFHFCDSIKELGFDIYFDTSFKCLHYQMLPF